MLRFFFVSLLILGQAVVGHTEESPFDEESKSVARPRLDISSGDYDDLGKALRGSSEDVIVDRASKILAKDPGDVKALNGLATHYMKIKKFGLAKMLLNRALQRAPDESALHNNLAIIYLEEGEIPLAIASFKKSLAKGSYRLGTVNFSSLLLKHRHFQSAIGPLEDAFEQTKADLRRGQATAVDLANNYAVALMGTGDAKKAQSVFEAILESGSRDPEVYLNLAILQVDILGDKKNGQRTLSKLQFMTEDSGILRQARELEGRAK